MLGFPIRLGVAFLIIALFVPSLVLAAEQYSSAADEGRASAEADRVFEAAARIWHSGEGSTETVSVDVPAGYELVFGGDLGHAWSYSVEHRGETVSRTFASDPSVRFLEEFRASGHAEIVLVCEKRAGIYGVAAT